jgi:prophage maintenance system killer protein
MSMEVTLIGSMLVIAEGDCGPSVVPSAALETGESPPGSVEEAAAYGAWIIRHQPFQKDNREIGYEVMRQMLEEGGHSWPRPDEDAAVIEKMLVALEDGAITEAEFVDWVRLRVATA